MQSSFMDREEAGYERECLSSRSCIMLAETGFRGSENATSRAQTLWQECNVSKRMEGFKCRGESVKAG